MRKVNLLLLLAGIQTLKGSQNTAWGSAPRKRAYIHSPSVSQPNSTKMPIPMVVLVVKSTHYGTMLIQFHHPTIRYGALIISIARGVEGSIL